MKARSRRNDITKRKTRLKVYEIYSEYGQGI